MGALATWGLALLAAWFAPFVSLFGYALMGWYGLPLGLLFVAGSVVYIVWSPPASRFLLSIAALILLALSCGYIDSQF